MKESEKTSAADKESPPPTPGRLGDCNNQGFVRCLIQKALDTNITGKLIGMLVVSLVGFSLIAIQNYLYLHNIDQRINEIQFHHLPQYKVTQYILRGMNGFKISLIHLMKDFEEENSSSINDDIVANQQRIIDFKRMLLTLKTGGNLYDVAKISQKTMDVFAVAPAGSPEFLAALERTISELEILEEAFNLFVNTAPNTDEESEGTADEALDTIIGSLDELHGLITGMAVLVNGQNNSMLKETGKLIGQSQRHSFLVSLVIAIILTIATILYILVIVVPLKDILVKIKTIAQGEGDRAEKIDIRSKDEVGQLAGQLNKLVDSIFSINTFKSVIEEEETPTEVQHRLATLFGSRYSFDAFFIYEVMNNKNTMHVIHSSDYKKVCAAEILENSNLCRAKRTGHAISSFHYEGICKQFPHGKTLEHHCIPMISGGNVISIVQLLFPKGRKSMETERFEEEIKRASRYIHEATPVLQAKRFAAALQETTMKDPMTGLYNRRFLESYMDTLIAGTTRRGTQIGILMCDMDFFKEVNDNYGHESGDTVIKKTAEIIETNVRAADMVIRYGGEEFLVLLLDIKERQTIAELAERIRATMESTSIKLPGKNIKKTISIGHSMFPSDTEGFWEAIKYADVALYRAKEDGRNRVISFTPDMWGEEAY